MKLNEGHFSFGTVIIHFGKKPYQETHFKSHLNSHVNSHYFVKNLILKVIEML